MMMKDTSMDAEKWFLDETNCPVEA